MWRNWFGPKTRIIGIDMNPAALKWKDQGFEIVIGDQGDPNFWKKTLTSIGKYDALLDDGGHQSFQQIVTLTEAIRYAPNKCIVAIEDTHTSFMHDFKAHNNYTFLNYAKSSTDFLTAKGYSMYPNRMKEPVNTELLDLFNRIHSIQFFNSLVAYKINQRESFNPATIWNHKNSPPPSDFRYEGLSSAEVLWPDPFRAELLKVKGGRVS